MPLIAKSDIAVGCVVWVKGMKIHQDDIVNTCTPQTRSQNLNGKSRHLGVVLANTEGRVTLAMAATFGAHIVLPFQSQEARDLWVPVTPAVQEPGMKFTPVSRLVADDAAKCVWISVRGFHFIEQDEYMMRTDHYGQEVVDFLLDEINKNIGTTTAV